MIVGEEVGNSAGTSFFLRACKLTLTCTRRHDPGALSTYAPSCQIIIDNPFYSMGQDAIFFAFEMAT